MAAILGYAHPLARRASRVLRLAAPPATAAGRAGLASGRARSVYLPQPAVGHAPAARRRTTKARRIRRVLKAHGLLVQPPRSFVPRPTACSACRPLPPRIESGWATSRICPGKAAAGCTWPCGWTAAAQNLRLGRARQDARRPSQRSAAPGLGRAAAPGRARGALRPRQPEHTEQPKRITQKGTIIITWSHTKTVN